MSDSLMPGWLAIELNDAALSIAEEEVTVAERGLSDAKDRAARLVNDAQERLGLAYAERHRCREDAGRAALARHDKGTGQEGTLDPTRPSP